MVEMVAITALVIVPLVVGMLQVSRMCMVSQLLTNAAREGCRVAVRNGNASADVTTRVNAALSASGISTTGVVIQLTPMDIGTTHLGDSIRLDVSVPFRNVSWLPYTYFFASTMSLSGSAIMSSERP
jgi:hypothetical protein